MCGRFAQTPEYLAILSRFQVTLTIGSPRLPAYNIAPTQLVPVVTQESEGRALRVMRWGLVPSWAKDQSIGNSLINARGESVAEKPSFRSAFKRRRCLVPASGFFEWAKAERGKKRPHYLYLRDAPLFAMAGLYEVWRLRDSDEPLFSFTIVTTAANPLVAPIHDRMPVILPPEDEEAWLDPESDPATLQSLLRPYPAGQMSLHEVSPAVGSPRHATPDCVEPHGQTELF